MIDQIIVACSVIGLIVSMIFLLTIIKFRRQCFSTVHVIAANIQLAIFVSSFINLFSIANVLKGNSVQLIQSDSSCIWRSFFVYTGVANIYYSFVIQSFYGYTRVMYPGKPRYPSARLLCVIIVVQWVLIHGVMLFLPLGNFIQFELNSQMCFVPLSNYLIIWLMAIFIYLPPFNLISYVYMRLAWFIKRSRTQSSIVNTINARRELELVKRMVIVLLIFAVSAAPYTIYAILVFTKGNLLPVDHYRIITLFNTMALAVASNTILLQSSDVRKTIIACLMRRDERRVRPSLLTIPHTQIPMQ